MFYRSFNIFCRRTFNKRKYEKNAQNYGNFDLDSILEKLKRDYNDRGIELVEARKKYFFRTSSRLYDYLRVETKNSKSI